MTRLQIRACPVEPEFLNLEPGPDGTATLTIDLARLAVRGDSLQAGVGEVVLDLLPADVDTLRRALEAMA